MTGETTTTRSTPKPTVLLVEDDPLLRLFEAEFLDEAGFEVIEAGASAEALPYLEQRADIRVLWTDIEMPGEMNGLELAQLVHERYPRIGILIASGRTFPPKEMLPPGATFFGKPYSTSRLLDQIRALVA